MKRFENRLELFALILFFVFLGLVLRLGYLQIIKGDDYAKLADGNRIRLISVNAPRGLILDRNNEVLVSNRAGFSVFIVPFKGPIDRKVVKLLSDLVEISYESLEKKIKQNEGRVDPILVKADLTPEMIAKVEERRGDLPGVVIEAQAVRDYPNKEIAGHMLGYISEIN